MSCTGDRDPGFSEIRVNGAVPVTTNVRPLIARTQNQHVTKNTATFEALCDFNRSIELPATDHYVDPGLGVIGLLLLEPPENFGYHQTPFNSLTFAHLGVDGIHIGSVTNHNCLDHEAPVVLTIPMGAAN